MNRHKGTVYVALTAVTLTTIAWVHDPGGQVAPQPSPVAGHLAFYGATGGASITSAVIYKPNTMLIGVEYSVVSPEQDKQAEG